MAGQSTGAVVGILALVRTGRTVVVLDDHLPPARLGHVVRLAGVGEVIADADRAGIAEAVVAESGGRVHDLRTLLEAAEGAVPSGEPDTRPRRGGTDPLVLVFTSGSTGLPKGVTMTHRQELQNAEQDAVALGLAPGTGWGSRCRCRSRPGSCSPSTHC
ncbi:class I adenylate-forming enzyme family protein [Curtobacterium flaccumfaciens]|nr:class I adenylate-forming enzyme family protein [Curtobacterium flaccumfaciens]